MIHVDFYIDIIQILRIIAWIFIGAVFGGFLLFNFIFKR